MIAGELHRADFAVTGCDASSMAALSERSKAAKGKPSSEAATLMKKAPMLDRADQSLEQRRSVTTSAILEGGEIKGRWPGIWQFRQQRGRDGYTLSGGAHQRSSGVFPVPCTGTNSGGCESCEHE